MPTSARKSSIGVARRGLQKAHVPYRGDDPTVGKKTGVRIRQVERKSDGFEPFDELMEQVDKRTPPQLQVAKKRKKSVPAAFEEEDEYGEMSMEIDTPRQLYFTNSRQLATPSNHRHSARNSDIDFDRIPSARSARNSLGPGPSRLSSSFRAEDPQDDDDDDDNDPDPGYGGGYYDDQPGHSGEQDSPQGTSFQEMDQEDDEQQEPDYEEPEENEPPPPSKRDKGKGRATLPDVPEERESDIEAEIAQGLEDVREQTFSDDEAPAQEEPEPSPRRAKKIKVAENPPKASRPKTAKVKKENRLYREGVRKSARERYEPLDWWRGEKLVYGRSQGSNGLVLVAPVKEIVRIPKEIPEPLGKRKRSVRAKSKTVDDIQYKVIPVENPEEGWDDNTNPYCTILDYDLKTEVERRIAYVSKSAIPDRETDSGWRFMKAFGDAEFIAAGILIIPPGQKKPTKQTKDNTYIFYVVEGAVNLRVHNSNRMLSNGAIFIVPRGNAYYIENVSERDAKLFFTQARKVVEDNPPNLAPPRRSSVGTAVGRSSSAGAAPAEPRAMSGAPVPKRATTIR